MRIKTKLNEWACFLEQTCGSFRAKGFDICPRRVLGLQARAQQFCPSATTQMLQGEVTGSPAAFKCLLKEEMSNQEGGALLLRKSEAHPDPGALAGSPAPSPLSSVPGTRRWSEVRPQWPRHPVAPALCNNLTSDSLREAWWLFIRVHPPTR